MGRGLVNVRVTGEQQTRESLKALRREIGKAAKEELYDAARTHAVPPARSASPSVYRDNIVAFATTRGAGITVRGSRKVRSIAGYLEHGGTIHAHHGGYLTFQVHGKWVRVRSVSRPVRKQGRYILPAIQRPEVVRAVLVDVSRGLTPKLGVICARAGADVGAPPTPVLTH